MFLNLKIVVIKMNKRVIRMIRKSQIVLEVIDIRCPLQTRARVLEEYLHKRKKPFIRVFNKMELVPKSFVDLVTSKMKGIPVSAKKRWGLRKLRDKIKEYKGGREKVVVSVVGMPNTGKSSLINALRGKKVTGVAPIPGHTKGEQFIRLSKSILISDTPGVLKLSVDEKRGDPLRNAIKILKKADKSYVKRFYKLSADAPTEMLEEMMKNRGWKEVERAARKVIQDWNSGKLKVYWFGKF